MGLYNFKRQFVPFILSGRKTHTIRAKRKHREKPGNLMHLYTGLRQKGAQRLMVAPCVKVEDVKIEMRKYEGPGVLANGLKFPHVIVDGVDLSWDERQALARADGFRDFAEMMAFWEGRLPFEGDIIHWDYKRAKHIAKQRRSA
jgi:hypothetical protein